MLCRLGHSDRPDGLALIASLRKRLTNLPGDLAAGVMREVCLQNVTWAARGTG